MPSREVGSGFLAVGRVGGWTMRAGCRMHKNSGASARRPIDSKDEDDRQAQAQVQRSVNAK
jgi:hypothetical protein